MWQRLWYSNSPLGLLLWPLAGLFGLLAALRRFVFRRGWKQIERLPVPVIVVGNISVGGSGKTPLVLWLAEYLKSHGYHPGIVSRGYGGKAESWPQRVSADSDPREVGDEALLLARRSGLPLAVGPQRPEAARLLLAEGVDVVIADDGLQHYRLGRDIEIAVVDGERRYGNARLLPAGPLREPLSRLASVDFVVANGEAEEGEFSMQLLPEGYENLQTSEQREPFAFAGRTVHAVAGIGNPQRFFDTLRSLGVEPIEHPFADHHPYAEGELNYDATLHLIMSEKDGVKWRPYAASNHWQLRVAAELPDAFGEQLLARLREVSHGQ